jgi:hypothetical protein
MEDKYEALAAQIHNYRSIADISNAKKLDNKVFGHHEFVNNKRFNLIDFSEYYED